ncbi:hypothetical protein HUO13_05370 [Saccharopolyspora erythraea]|uniref:hypothetical protein n=1 Tax=Saccharopolyspora erythraea TaxID=1836 RepID=UPI001BAD7BB1|nr:hypothetical protein [Saccharopolyspora erythraea]QUH00324.1 hypothetical protein HUO13_05370 [Saccharopolyspora erythraea]
MGTRTPEQRLVAALARSAVEAAAPDELPLFEETCDEYLRRPARGDRGFDDPLGFGLDTALSVLTFGALAAAQSAAVFVALEVRSSVREESSSTIRAWTKRLFRRLQPPDDVAGAAESAEVEVPALTPEQLRRVREHAYEQARAFHVPRREAGIMADAIVGRLSLPDEAE